MENPEISIILPCLNEEQAIGRCLKKIKQIINQNNINSEIIVVDNNSTDNSKQIAINNEVIVLNEIKKGYGNAYKKGLKYAKGENIIMVDCDCSYDYTDIPKFTNNLKKYDFVLGNRFSNMDKNAMPLLNKLGNSIIRFLLKINGFKAKEVCTGFVGIKKQKIPKLKCEGMEFSSEFLINTKNLNMIEIPIKFHKRIGKPKLKRFKDGFRHLKFLLSAKLRNSSQ